MNQGLGDLGQLVKANLLTPLDSYSAKWGWGKRQSAALLTIDGRATPKGQIGSGKLYGISTTGDWVGVFYNKAKMKELGIAVPKTLAEFEKALATAKAAGETPIAFGNLDKWPGIHEFQSVLMAVAPAAQVGNTIFGKPGSKWSTPAVLKAAATVQKWAKAGYYSDGYAGLGYDDATKNFVKGTGVFTITGTWKTGDMASGLKSNVGLMLLPAARAGQAPGALASGGLAWAIPAKAKNRELSANYINFITSPAAAKVIQAAGDVPAIVVKQKPAGVKGDALARLGEAQHDERDGRVHGLGDADVLRHGDGGDPGADGRKAHAGGVCEEARRRLPEVPQVDDRGRGGSSNTDRLVRGRRPAAPGGRPSPR